MVLVDIEHQNLTMEYDEHLMAQFFGDIMDEHSDEEEQQLQMNE